MFLTQLSDFRQKKVSVLHQGKKISNLKHKVGFICKEWVCTFVCKIIANGTYQIVFEQSWKESYVERLPCIWKSSFMLQRMCSVKFLVTLDIAEIYDVELTLLG